MRNIAVFDTSYGTLNLGDFIINKAISEEMDYLFRECFCLRISTHAPVLHVLQAILPTGYVRALNSMDLKFICGTNILALSQLRISRNWNINLIDAKLYKGSVLLGVGTMQNAKHCDAYTRAVYRRALSRKYVHSVRDERTAEFVRSLGLEALPTGCPTTWQLSQESVDAAYARPASDTVLFTLTDYAKDPERDAAVVRDLSKRYKRILLWPQGVGDWSYAREIGILDSVEVIAPSFDAYLKIMDEKFDYVGTRLHGGIFALSHGHRTLILAVDHRATDMAETTGLPVVTREAYLTDGFGGFDKAPQLKIPTQTINDWKEQFVGV